MANGRARPRRAACKSRTRRWACARLTEHLQPTRTQVLDDSSHVQLAPDRRFHGAVADLLQPERQPRLIQKQAEILAIVIATGGGDGPG